jgi:hypothetical protein
MRRWAGTAGRGVALAAVLAAVLSPATASAVTGADFNTFDQVTFSEVKAGAEVPLDPGIFEAEYDSSHFTMQSGEEARCGPVWGFKSGWTRFVPAYDGVLTVRVSAASYPGMVLLWNGPALLGSGSISELPPVQECNDNPTKSSKFETQIVVTRDHPVSIQTDTRCGEGESLPAACEQAVEAVAAGGSTKVTAEYALNHTGEVQREAVEKERARGEAEQREREKREAEGRERETREAEQRALAEREAAARAAAQQAAVDTDHDGIPDSEDLCRTEFAVRGISTAGDGRKGCPEPLEGLLSFLYANPRAEARGTTVRRAQIGELPAGSRVLIVCAGSACPQHVLVDRPNQARTFNFLPALARGRFRARRRVVVPAGTTITVTVTQAGALGKRWTIPFSRRGARLTPSLCLGAGGTVLRCPGTGG